MKNQTKGILFALLTATISGVAIFYSKISVAKIDPLILATSRNLFVGTIFLLIFAFSKKFVEIKKLSRDELVKLTVIGLIGGSVPFYLFFTGLQLVNPQIANLIHKSLFIWVGLLAVIFLKEKLNILSVIAFVLVIFGNYYFAKIPFQLGKGELMILTATLLWSMESILAKKVLSKASSEIVGLFRMGLGSLVLLFAVLVSGKFPLFLSLTTNHQSLTTILIGGMILFGYVFFWFKALKYAPASLVTLVLTFSVVVGNILNGTFAGVKLLPKDIYTSASIFAATVLIYLSSQLRISKIKS